LKNGDTIDAFKHQSGGGVVAMSAGGMNGLVNKLY